MFLLVRVFARALLQGRANRVPKVVFRIIIVPTGKLGDVVCTTPVLMAIRTYLPKAHLIVGGNSKLHKAVLSNSGLVDEYLELEDNQNVINKIRKCHADVALVTGPSYELAAPLYVAGIPLLIAPIVCGGFSPQETRPYKLLERLVKTFPYCIGEYAPRERLKALGPLGITSIDTKKYLGFSENAGEKIANSLIESGIDINKDFVVGVSPSAGHKIKDWPEERFAEVVDYLIKVYRAKIIMIGGPKDKETIKKTMSLLRSEMKILETTDFDIDELKALIAKLHLLIAIDTGPIYIAEAFDIPTIDIIGPIDEKEQPPRGPLNRNVLPPERKRPELFVLNARSYNRKEAIRQVRSITVSLVINEIDLLISDIKKQQ